MLGGNQSVGTIFQQTMVIIAGRVADGGIGIIIKFPPSN